MIWHKLYSSDPTTPRAKVTTNNYRGEKPLLLFMVSLANQDFTLSLISIIILIIQHLSWFRTGTTSKDSGSG